MLLALKKTLPLFRASFFFFFFGKIFLANHFGRVAAPATASIGWNVYTNKVMCWYDFVFQGVE